MRGGWGLRREGEGRAGRARLRAGHQGGRAGGVLQVWHGGAHPCGWVRIATLLRYTSSHSLARSLLVPWGCGGFASPHLLLVWAARARATCTSSSPPLRRPQQLSKRSMGGGSRGRPSVQRTWYTSRPLSGTCTCACVLISTDPAAFGAWCRHRTHTKPSSPAVSASSDAQRRKVVFDGCWMRGRCRWQVSDSASVALESVDLRVGFVVIAGTE